MRAHMQVTLANLKHVIITANMQVEIAKNELYVVLEA